MMFNDSLAVYLATPLLALALTHCAGKASHDPTSNGGQNSAGTSSAGAPAGGGSSAVGGADPGLDGSIVVPIGDEPASPPPQCNALERNTSPITRRIVADNPPEPQGGVISNGIYHLTEREDFVGPSGSSSVTSERAFAILAISASTGVTADLQISWRERGGELPLTVEQSQTIVVSGSAFAYTVTCSTELGYSDPGSLPFTATPDQLIWFHSYGDAITRVDTYTRE